MSFEAMTWAVKQTTGDPASKLVLMILANYAGADGSCWPGQDTIARLSECCERSVRTHLTHLEEAGLMRRVERRRSDGRRNSDMIVLCMKAEEEVENENKSQPAKSAGSEIPTGKVRHANRQSTTSQPANLAGIYKDEPIIEPISEPSCMGGAEFEDLIVAYVPFAPGDNRSSAVGFWRTLSPEDQNAAVSHAKAFCAGIKGQPPYLITYLRERRWQGLSAPARALAVEYVYPGTKRWDEVKRATGKSDSTMFLGRGPSGRECFAYYAQPVKQEGQAA